MRCLPARISIILVPIRRDLLGDDLRQPARHVDGVLPRLLDAQQHLLDAHADLVGAGDLPQLAQRLGEVLLAVEGLDLAEHGNELGVRVDAGHRELVVEDGLQVELAQDAAV
jgi:hypothetical protein